MNSAPVRRYPPAVYWRRRALVLVAVVVLISLIVAGINALFGGDDGDQAAAPAPTNASSATSSATAAPSASPSGSTTASASPSSPSSTTPAAPADCAAGQVSVEATVDKEAYKGTDTAKVGMFITNTSSQPCRMDVGSGPLSLTITSGSDRIWSSDDCVPAGRTSRMALVQPGNAGRLGANVTWNLDRSRPGCPGGTPRAGATRTAVLKPGIYRLHAKAGDFVANPKVFRIE